MAKLSQDDYRDIAEHNGVSVALAEMVVQTALMKIASDRTMCFVLVGAALEGAGLTEFTCNLGQAAKSVGVALKDLA